MTAQRSDFGRPLTALSHYRIGAPGTAADRFRADPAPTAGTNNQPGDDMTISTAQTGSRFEYTDRRSESDRTFQQRLQQWETRAAVDVASDVVQERVARAICLAAYHGEPEWIWDRMGSPLRDDYLRLAAAALAAMPPADETLRESVEAEVVELCKLAATYDGIVIDNIEDGIDENADGKASAYTAAAERLRRILGGSR